MNPNQVLAQQIDSLINEYQQFRRQSRYDDCSDVIPNTKALEMVTRARAAIERVGGITSAYQKQAELILKEKSHEYDKLWQLVGVLQSLSQDIKAGYLKSFEELIHGEVFADFLEMAQYLVENGYKDAAAVVAGSMLEAHLRQLARRAGIDTDAVTPKGSRPKSSDLLNAELAKASVYGVLEQKSVTAWLDLRNKAAHGHYREYQKEQVALMVSAIRDFNVRHPA